MPKNRTDRTRWTPGILAAAVLGTGFLLGGVASDAWRQAAFGQNAAPAQRMFIEHTGDVAVPAIAVDSNNGFAVVGANDGRYYIIYRDGTSVPVFGDGRRLDLYWR